MRICWRAMVACAMAGSLSAIGQTLPATSPSTAVTTQAQNAMTLGQADSLMNQKRYAEAAEAYRSLLHSRPPTALLYGRLASALHEQNRGEPLQWKEERQAWEHALLLDPKNVDALRGLFEAQKRQLRFFGDSKSASLLRDAAKELLAADPSAKEAQSWSDVSYLIEWLQQADAPDQDMNVHRQALLDRMAKEQLDPLLTYYIARTFVEQAESLRKHSEAAEEKAHLQQAIDLMQKAVDADPQNAAAWLLDYHVLRAAEQVARGDDKKDTTYSDKAASALEKAQQVAKPDDMGASEIATLDAAYLADHNRVADAEKVLRGRLEAVPEDQSARNLLARIFEQDASKRSEMIDLLRKPVTDPGGPQILTCKMHLLLEREAQSQLLQLLVSQWYAALPGNEKTQLSQEIDRRLADMQRVAPQSVNTMQIHARLLLLRGGQEGAMEAVAELEKARQMLHQHSGDMQARDWDLEFLLATAYTITHQTGLAKTLLWQIVDARPQAPQVRKSLLRLLIVDHDADLADEQLQALKRLAPNDPDVPQLSAAVALLRPGAGRRPDAQAALKALPESTRQQIYSKIVDESAAGNKDEVIRLYELLRKQYPGDASVVKELAALYRAAGQSDQAEKVVREALAADPKNLSLQLIDAQMHQDAARIDQIERQQLDGLPDAFDRDMAWASYYFIHRDVAETAKRLDDAEKLRPSDPKLLGERLNLAIALKQWDVADSYVQKRAKVNADDVGGLSDRCRVDVVRGKLDAALAEAQKLTQKFPQFAGSWTWLGDVYQVRGEFQKAIDAYKQGLQRHNESTICFKGLIACTTALHQPRETKRYIDAALQIAPSDAYFRQQLQSWERSNLTPAQIVQQRKAARDANPDSLAAWQDLFVACYQAASPTSQPSIADCEQVATQMKEKWPDEKLGYIALADAAMLRSDLVAGERAMCALADRPAWKKSAVPWIFLAQYYERFKRTDLQEYALRQALDHDPQSDDAQNAAADFFIARQRYGDVVASLNSASPDWRIRRKIIFSLMSLGNQTEAIKACDSWLAIHPEDDYVWTDKAMCLDHLNRSDEAIEAVNKALQANPKNRDALYTRGAIYLIKGPPSAQQALADLKVSSFSPTETPGTNSDRLAALADAAFSAGKATEGIDALKLSVSILPTNTPRRKELVELCRHLPTPDLQYADKLIRESIALEPANQFFVPWSSYCIQYLLAEGDAPAAVNRARSDLALITDEKRRDALMVDLLLALLHDHEDQKVLDEAHPETMRSFDSNDALLVYAERAVAEYRLGQQEAARRDLQQMVALAGESLTNNVAKAAFTVTHELPREDAYRLLSEAAGDHAAWLCQIMLLYYQQMDLPQASAVADKIVALAKANQTEPHALIQTYCALIYSIAGQYDKARELANGLRTEKTTHADILYLLAMLWSDGLGDHPDLGKAQVLADQAILHVKALQPDQAEAWDIKGWLLVRDGQMDQGMQYLTAAATMNADNADVHYHLGRAYQMQGKHDQAMREWKLAQKLLDDWPHRQFAAMSPILDGTHLIAADLKAAMASGK